MSEEEQNDTTDESSLFIRTEGAVSRINLVVNGMKSGIPLLLEGETGTSKTATAKCAAKEINQKVILFNFSSQTSVEDLLGRITKSSDEWGGFSFKKGPFTIAFEKGYCIILDEINLALETVLQCIQSSLDSRTLSLDFSGSEVDKTIQMHPDFHIVATQNPLNSNFSQKRNYLSHNFTSRFQTINFGQIERNELIEIATGLSTNIDVITPQFINSLIQFHFDWQKNKHSCSITLNKTTGNSSSTNYVFTIREICRTIKSIEKGLTPFESIMVNYGSRYDIESQNAMKELLHTLDIDEEYKFFKSSFYIQHILDNNIYNPDTKIVTTNFNNKFYMTKTLSDIYSTCFHLLDNFQPILLVGPNGCGKTSMGRWIGDLYTSYIASQTADPDDDDNSQKHSYKFFICNPEMTISDIIGRYLPNKQSSGFTNPQAAKGDDINNNYSDAPIEWMYGPVVKAMVNGDCLILDQIDTAPSTILERLNSLFDGLGVKDFKFPIQENLENPEALVDPKFRIIATSSLNGLNDLSPAFLNRFTVVYVEEQLRLIDDELPQFIRCISPYSKSPSKGSKDIKFISDSIAKTLGKDNILTSLNLSKCVNGFFRLLKKFPEADKKSIIKFCFDSCIYHTSKVPEMDDDFINILLESLAEDDRKDTEFDAFHFKEATSTRKVMATLVACSVIGLHTILVGKTGTGKTTAAMAFARMNKFSTKTSTPSIIAFSGETQLDELYGYFTIEKGNFTLHQGDLSKAMSSGEVFIADELNLADQQIIQSLNVAIEPSYGETIILPVTGSSIDIKEGFFFIGCQNDLTMNGRRPIPESIRKKILIIDYPENSPDDLRKLCTSIASQFNFDRAIPKFTAAMIEKMKTEPTLRMKPWSLREVRTLFRRIAYFKNKTQDIIGFTSIHHVSFMLASSYQNYDEIIEQIAELVCSSFMQKGMKESLIKDLKADIKVEKNIDESFVSKAEDSEGNDKDNTKTHYKITLTKGSLKLNISNAQLNDIPENLQTLWQTVFNIYLTTQSEPLLFIGPSGFKTYLSELFSSLAPVIYLHSDSTISSLIGQIALLDYYQAKLSLLEAIDDFTGHDMTLKEPLNEIKKQLEENDEIDEESLRNVIDKIKESVPESFIPIITNVANRLIDIQNEERDFQNNPNVGDRMFSKYISIFKPGLITKSIFSQNSLILKNFAQPAPSVIERFNELFSVTPQLTLFEDTTNTFTTQTNNKIFGFSSVFRIIAICIPPEKRNLSDAMLSRLTEIYIPTYSKDDQECVFKNYLEMQLEHDISLTIRPLSILKKALDAFEAKELNISFRQKIKIIQIAYQWQKKFPEVDVSTIYIISILRCAGGPLPFELKQDLYQIIKETFDPKGDSDEFPSQFASIYQSIINDDVFTDTYKCTMALPCLSLINDGDTICSSLTNFTYPNISFMNNILNDAKQNFRFTYSNYDLIDLIFSLSIINYPLIIEGPNGCGKSSAFFYVAECLGVKVIQISISRSTTVEDLFGRFEPNAESENLQFDFKPTAFLNAIDNDRNSGEKYWILIEELHLASPSVIDALEPIFNPQSDHVTLPDGSYIQRGNFFIVGLLSKSLQKQSITNSAMHYKVRNYTKSEFTEICKFILESNKYGGITKQICPILEKLYENSASSHIKIPVTPREALKFIKMMNAATQHSHKNDQLSEFEISRILFLGRFVEEGLKESNKEVLDDILKEQGYTQNEEIPEFTTENGGSILTSQKVSIDVSMRTQSRHNEIDHLTTSERQLFEFLILNVQEYTPIIVQGPTASGKTFAIQLFADVLGKNLKVLQMNSEINSSYIAGSYQPNKELSPNDISELQNALSLIIDFAHLLPRKFQAKIRKNSIKEWTPGEFSELKKCVSNLLIASLQENDDDDDDEIVKLEDENDIENAKEFINKANSSLLFFNHLERNDSLIIKALLEGHWLLLDGIESAPSDFLDRLSTLLDDPPILNLYERGSDYIYSTDPEKSKRSQRIHPDFRLFMTFNPVNTSANNVSPSFLSRCTLFSMNPVDSFLFDSAVVVSGIIEQCFFAFSIPSEISARIASIHSMMKKQNQEQPLTCRTLIHISREISYKNKSEKIDLQQLKDIIFNHYFQGHPDDKEYEPNKKLFYNDIDAIFEEKIDDNLLEKLQKIERNTSKACNIMINIINDLQSQLVKIINLNQDNDDDDDDEEEDDKGKREIPKFKYDEFLSNLSTLQLKDIDQIASQFRNPMKFIRDNISKFTKEQISYLASVATIYELINQFQEEFSSRRDTNKIQNLFLDSDFIRNIQSFSTILYQITAFTSLYHRGLYMNKIPDVLIDADFAKAYFQLFKFYENDQTITPRLISLVKKNKYYSNNLPDDINDFDFSPYKWDDNITPLQQICSSLFKCKKCRYLFEGVMKDLFIATYAVFNSENIELFSNWINWLELFFKTFGSTDYNVKFEQFKDLLDELKENENGDFIIDLMNKIEKIKSVPQGFDLEDKLIEKTQIRLLILSINSLYDNLKEKFLAVTENKKAAEDFFALKEKIIKLTEKNDSPLQKPYELLYNHMDVLGQNITLENFNFINKVFLSISQSSKKAKTQNNLEWPTNQNLKQIEEKRSKLLESLISYSKELEKVEMLENSPKWTILCELPDSEPLMEEFIKEKSISEKSINSYKSILRAQFLVDLYEIGEKDPYNYCNTKKLILFFNQFNNRYNFVDDNWAIIAQKLSKIYPVDFCISIPSFDPFDIISLLLNPLSKKQGCIFNEKQCPQKLIDDFYDLYIEIDKKLSKQSFKYISGQIEKIAIEYAKNLHPDIIRKNFDEDELDDFSIFSSKIVENNILDDIKEICERIQIVINFSESITTTLNKEHFKDENFDYLDFSDVMDIDFDDFNSYIDKNPCSGFYITQFPQVKDNISRIVKLCSDNTEYDNNDKFPLALFEFRIFSRARCIEFQMPSEFPHDLAEDFQEFLYKEILTHLTKVPKISNFSNFISFLLANTPNFITDTCHSEHLRNIVINLISSPKEKLLKTEMLQFFKRFLPKIIEKLGTPKWIDYNNEELKYESKDEIIRFLTNPWRFALEDIDRAIKEEYEIKEFDVQKAVKNIINMITSLSSDKSIEQLKECANKDESELRDKIYHEFVNSKKNSKKETEIEKELNKEWTDYSKYIKSYLGSKVAALPSTSSNNIHQPDDSFNSFHTFFSQKLNYLPSRSTEIIVLLPKKTNSSTYTLHYTIQNKKVSAKFQSSEGKPMLFLPPKNQTIESLNLRCEGVDIQIDVIQSDHEVVKFKYTSMKSIEESYKKFNKCFEEIQKADFEDSDHIQIMKKIGKVNIVFGELTLDEFIEKLKALNAKYSKEEIKNFYGRPDELTTIKDDILDLEQFTNISFLIDHMEKPHQTTDFIQGSLINIITSAKNNLVKSKFDLFNDDYDRKCKFFFDSKNEFQKLSKISSKIQLKPKNVKSYNIETSNQDMDKIEASDQLLTPSIFKNEEELKVTIKKIEIEADPLIFGVDVSPLQIRLGNFTEEDIMCEFDQIDEDLPFPKYKNEIGFLIIEIPVDLICNSALKYIQKDENSQQEKQEPLHRPTKSKQKKIADKNEFIDIEKTFVFNGFITLSINDDTILPAKIEYHISLHYISLIEFISIKNNHFFAFKDERIEVVPFLAGPNSKLMFEKFTDKAIKRNNMLDCISELNDNKANKPEFQSKPNLEDERSIDITTIFTEKDNKNTYLSMNYEFGITKEKALVASLHINTSPKLDKIGKVTLALFSDNNRNFTDKDKDAIINVGNLKRKVYFFVGVLNTGDEPISPKKIELTSYSNFINAKYDESKNTNTIPPNQYGYAIYYFEVRYTGLYPYPNKDKYNGSITVTINGLTQTLNFKYKVNAIENLGEKLKFNTNILNCLYYDQKKDSFTQCDIRNVFQDPIFRNCEKQILISPFCYSLYDKLNLLTRIEYDHTKGVLSRLIYDKSKPPIFEVFGFFSNSKRFMTVTIDKPEKISIRDKNTYIFGRLKDEPSTFFPLFCPIKYNNREFDARKCTNENIFSTFINFFLSMMPTHDQNVRKPYTTYSTIDYLFDQTPFPSTYNFSFIIDLIGKGRKHLTLNEVVPTIVKFTNDYEFRDHYLESRNQLKNDLQGQLYSFVSALNRLVCKRYEYLQSSSYYLKLPISFDVIKEKQNEIFQKTVLNIDQIETNKYINDFKKNIQNINDIEKNEIKKFTNNGLEISPILKYTEINGLTTSTIEELNAHKEHKIQQKTKVNTIKDENSEFNTKDIKSIAFPEKVTIKSLYDTFREVLSSTYSLTFIIYSLKKNHQPLNRAKNLLNQLIAVFLWQNECSGCFPFTSFKTYFITAFSSMMQRLINSKLSIINFPLFLLEKSDFNEFVQIPSLIVANINYPKFTQPGLAINVTEFKPVNKKGKNNNKPDTNIHQEEEEEGSKKATQNKGKAASSVQKRVEARHFRKVRTSKKVVFQEISENTKEIPDTEFIQYLIQDMIKDADLNDKFEYKPDKSSHIPDSIKDLDIIGDHNDRIDSFIEASKRLTDVLITAVNKSINEANHQINLLSKKDSVYATILIDCTSTLSVSYKSSLVTLAIAYANTLTAIKIPYAIVLFCDSNFQFILKTPDQDSDLVHFEKLLDSITVRRRMSDLPTAILMASDKVKCSDKNRTKHAIFALTDGLTNKLKLTDQWKNVVLNDSNKSVMFYFMDILSNTDQTVVHPIWDNFKTSIKDSKSANAVIYTKASDIYNGKSIFADTFIKMFDKFTGVNNKKDMVTIAEFPEPLSGISRDFLKSVTEVIQKDVPDETKFFSKYTFGNDIATRYTQVDLELIQPKPLDAFTAGIEEKDPEIITEFLKTLNSFSNSLIDSSLTQEIGTLIFPPNKPSQFTPSGKGSIFYFPGLIKFILTQGQDTKIFLEKKAGLIRSYSVFFVIDNSSSCFNTATVSHAFQTIYSLLYPLSKIDIPSLNIIVTTEDGPVILCSEKPTMMALDESSPLWISLFTYLSNPHPTRSCFYGALMNAYQMRIQQKSFSSVLFALTDGFYSFDERNYLNSIFESFKALYTIPITVGIGSDPAFIDLLTDKSIWAQNPKYIWPAVLFLFGKEARAFDSIKTAFSNTTFTQDLANSLENYLSQPNKVLDDLFNELNHVMRKVATYRNYYNENKSNDADSFETQIPANEKDANIIQKVPSKNGTEVGPGGAAGGELVNGEGEVSIAGAGKEGDEEKLGKNAEGAQFDLGKKDGYKGVKLLIIMCWDHTCSSQEDHRISEEVLRNGIDDKKISVVNALTYFGIETSIVKSYPDAIEQLGSGEYSQAWIICGRLDGTMPGNTDPETNDSNLIKPFVECLIEYWHRGGGIVFWTDNYPLAAEVNLFLRLARFYAPKKVTKKTDAPKKQKYKEYEVNFHIGGDYEGAKTLRKHRFTEHTEKLSAKSKSNCTFDGNPTASADGYEKELFNHELKYIFEGISIASAIKGKEQPNEWSDYKTMDLEFAQTSDIYPFRPFSKSSSGGFSSLYYMSPLDCNDGNVVIECGFSKLFFELTKEGIDRYVKNIAVWNLQIEKKDINFGNGPVAPYLIRPPKFDFQIDYDDTEVEFHKYNSNRKVDLVFMIDGTNSMRFFLDAARDSCINVAEECHTNFPNSVFRFGAVIYRDQAVSDRIQYHKKEPVEKSLLDEDPEILHEFLSNINPKGGGGDGPEDWVSGYRSLLKEMNWNRDSTKIVIHICDAPGHGTTFTAEDKYIRIIRKIPSFRRNNSFIQNLNIYDEIQANQDAQFRSLIEQAAKQEIMFFCMNGKRNAMYCFKRTQQIYYEKKGPKFVIQNQFGFGTDEDHDQEAHVNQDELTEQVKKIALSAVDIAVAVSGGSSSKEEDTVNTDKEFEDECQKQFDTDFNDYNITLEKIKIQREERKARGGGTRGGNRGRGGPRGGNARLNGFNLAGIQQQNSSDDAMSDSDDEIEFTKPDSDEESKPNNNFRGRGRPPRSRGRGGGRGYRPRGQRGGRGGYHPPRQISSDDDDDDDDDFEF